jgi:hypothetical protein
MITNMMITTPRDTPGKITSRKVGQSHRNLTIDTVRTPLLGNSVTGTRTVLSSFTHRAGRRE